LEYIYKFEDFISSLVNRHILHSNDNLMVVGVVMLVITFIPSIIAGARLHKDFGKILGANILFFWTYTVWIGLIIWAFYDKEPSKK